MKSFLTYCPEKSRSKSKFCMGNVLRHQRRKFVIHAQKVKFTFFPEIPGVWWLYFEVCLLLSTGRETLRNCQVRARQRFQRWLWCFWHGTRYSWWLFWCALRFSAGCTWRMYVQSNYKRPSNRERERGPPGLSLISRVYFAAAAQLRAPGTLNISCSKSTCEFELFTLCFTRELFSDVVAKMNKIWAELIIFLQILNKLPTEAWLSKPFF